MRKLARRSMVCIAALVCAAGLAGSAAATNFNIDWLSMAPVPYGSSMPNNSVYNLPGVGNVTVTYSIPANFTHNRLAVAPTNGGFAYGLDNYAWTNLELYSAIFTDGPDPLVPVPWSITYTFPSTLAAGTLYVDVAGLGRTTSFGGGTATATVNQNGTFLGEWSPPGGPWGPTQFTGGPGTFQMQNSVTGAGGVNPHWNTPDAVVRIDDAVPSLTVYFSNIRGDGLGLNIGYSPGGIVSTEQRTWAKVKGMYR